MVELINKVQIQVLYLPGKIYTYKFKRKLMKWKVYDFPSEEAH